MNATNQDFVPCVQSTFATLCLVVDHLQEEGIAFQGGLPVTGSQASHEGRGCGAGGRGGEGGAGQRGRGGGGHTHLETGLGGAPAAQLLLQGLIPRSTLQVTPQICPLIFYSGTHTIYKPLPGVKHILTRALPNLKLFMIWHSGGKSNFLTMSDVMIYCPFDMHVPKTIALPFCPSIAITLN